MAVVIREYEAKYKAELMHCIGQLQEHVASLDPLKRIRRLKDFDCEAYLQRTFVEVAKHNGVIYVAQDEGDIVGCIVGVIHQPAAGSLDGYPSIDAKILELMILPQHRGKRIGALLMQRIEDYFSLHDCSVIKVECLAPNKDAHTFYEKLGYADRLITLIKQLRPR